MKSFFFYLFLIFTLNTEAQIFFEDDAPLRGLTLHTGQMGNGNGLSFVDFDNDGWDDITLPSGDLIPLRFYKNYEGFFAEVDLLNPEIKYQTRAVSWVDYDNDGDKDLFVVSDTNGNRLFNNTNGVFSDVTAVSGLPPDNLETHGVSWGDINNDGCLDLYLSNRVFSYNVSNYLFQSNCDGTFFNATDEIGLSNSPVLTFCSSFFDFNNDGWQDLYVSNDKEFPNFLYKNNGDGTFTDVSLSSGTGIIVDAMSVTIDDFNNDGYFDIYITNTPSSAGTTTTDGAVLFKNNGDETFTNIAVTSGTEFNSWSWGANFIDAENDGDLDLYVSSSYVTSDGYPSFAFYENNGSEMFSSPSNIGFFNNEYRSYGSASGDLNNDGKADIVVINNFNSAPNLWHNKTVNDNNYLTVSLEGTVSNSDAVGARIEISVSGDKQYRYIINGESYLSQNSFKEFFGIGNSNLIDYVKINWLSGIEDILFNVTPNQTINIVEGSTLGVDSHGIDFFALHPNPVLNILNIKANNQLTNCKAEVYNMMGQKYLEKELKSDSNNYYIDLSTLPDGVYLVKIFNHTFKTSRVIFKK